MLGRLNWRARSRAALVHLTLSAGVALLGAALVFQVWFPHPYREISGGRELFTLVVVVDVVLGPLLTWVVFDQRKPRSELVRDLSVIVALQLGALAYGLWSVYLARPVYLVHEVDRFVALSAADVDPVDLPEALPEFRRLPFAGVRLIGLRGSRDGEERLRSLELALAGKDISMRPGYWQELSPENLRVIKERARPLTDLAARSEREHAQAQGLAQQIGLPMQELVYLPVVGPKAIWTAVLRAQTLEIVGYLPVDGF